MTAIWLRNRRRMSVWISLTGLLAIGITVIYVLDGGAIVHNIAYRLRSRGLYKVPLEFAPIAFPTWTYKLLNATAMCNSGFLQYLLVITAINLAIDVFGHNRQAVITRSFWEGLWATRLQVSGGQRLDMAVDRFGALRRRPHLVMVSPLTTIESWVLSDALFVIGTQAEGRVGLVLGLGVFAVNGYCVILVIIPPLHLGITIAYVWHTRFSADGLYSFGCKEHWIASRITQALPTDQWGALRLPRGDDPGVLGYGAHVVSPPPAGRYSSGGISFIVLCCVPSMLMSHSS